MGQDVTSKGAGKDFSKDDEKVEERGIISELDFADWYNDLEHELLDSSHDDYASATLGQIHRQAC